MNHKRRRRRDEKRDAEYRRAYELAQAAPPELTEAVLAAVPAITDAGTRLQVPPDQMIAVVSLLTMGVLLCNVDPRDELEINRRIAFAYDALHVAVAVRRIQVGAIAERPDGSFGIRADA